MILNQILITLSRMQEKLDFEQSEYPKSNLRPVKAPFRGRFPERYKIHQYWSRKPWYVVRYYIEHFTKEGDVILDPFCGSGVTACESLCTGRKVIARDINPISILITKLTCMSRIDLVEFNEVFKSVMEAASKKSSVFYETVCPICSKVGNIINTVFIDNKPNLITYHCECCQKTRRKNPDNMDHRKISQSENRIESILLPENVVLPPDSDVRYLYDLFTARNLMILGLLSQEIENLPQSNNKDFLKLMFTSTLIRCSKLIFVNKYRLDKGINPAGVWGEKRFWLPKDYIENNVLYYFNQRLLKIIKAKRETNRLIKNYELDADLQVGNAMDLSDIGSDTVDYCFTDPPYGGTVQYLNLSLIWNTWLGYKVDKKSEIIIDSIKKQNEYEIMLTASLKEIYRVLKKGKYVSITFHNSTVRIWNTLLRGCQKAGFDLISIISQEPSKLSHNQIDLEGTVTTDVVLTFRKPTNNKRKLNDRSATLDVNTLVSTTATKLLKQFQEASLYRIYDEVILKWIRTVYATGEIPLTMNLTLKQVTSILKSNGFVFVTRKQRDYKNIEREIIIWKLPNNG